VSDDNRAAALLLDLAKDEHRCMQLLEALDKTARAVDSYEYGLPLWDEAHCAQLREVLYRWAAGSL
jgi:hypothetical protein